jgi:hypothetical protein
MGSSRLLPLGLLVVGGQGGIFTPVLSMVAALPFRSCLATFDLLLPCRDRVVGRLPLHASLTTLF